MNKQLIAVGMMVVLSVVLLSGCNEKTPSEKLKEEKFEVHEWGVFLKVYDCNQTSVSTQPLETFFVDKPVIFFHSLENITNITVEVNSIRNVTVIPNATTENNQILWNIAVENNSIIVPNGTKYPYLFYEGEINCSPNIIANITVNKTNATFYVKNIAEYTISNIYFIYGGYLTDSVFEYNHYGITFVQIDKLDANEEKSITVQLTNDTSYDADKLKPLLSSLIEKGLTNEEAEEMIHYWQGYWFYPSNAYTYTRLIYLVPQSVYDQLLPMTITPQPDLTKRIGIFTITDISVNTS